VQQLQEQEEEEGEEEEGCCGEEKERKKQTRKCILYCTHGRSVWTVRWDRKSQFVK
jgi:hydroxylamine reductase (hybrid-cluster protein)